MRMLYVIVIAVVGACGQVDRLADASGDNGDGGGTPDSSGNATCGDGNVGGTEACDLGANNGQAGFCCSSQCQYEISAVVCRASVGTCDVAETCSGSAADCPADSVIDGVACTDNGGSTCCGGGCSHVAVPGTCDACAVRANGPQNIAVIESQSMMVGHDMDVQWEAIAEAAGHTVTIHPQTALDSLTSFDGTDILIVSSGLIPIPANRRAVIDAYASSGRGVYLQGEYQTIYEPNITFGEIVVAHGSTFAWNATVVGQQDPTTVNGCLATTPEAAATLIDYWYACTGTAGAEVEVIHTAPGGQPIGWSYCLPGGGLIIHNTDQDFIRDQVMNPTTQAHMRNVIVALADAANCDGGVVD